MFYKMKFSMYTLWMYVVIFFIVLYVGHYSTLNYFNDYSSYNISINVCDNIDKNLKYMLIWTENDYSPFYNMGIGQEGFVKRNCLYSNCYITNNRLLLNNDYRNFDAIIFNGRTLNNFYPNNLPEKRSSRQKYIYLNQESSINYPVCNKFFDRYFNLTATFRLNSDIKFPYVEIKDLNNSIVGPRNNMNWEIEDKVIPIRQEAMNKTKSVIWVVSNCRDKSNRGKYVIELKKELKYYGYKVDEYGECFNSYVTNDWLYKTLKEDYYFFLSMENSLEEDYVSEKLLHAVQNDVVPIVFGGANYSRFLPPNSYLNALELSPKEIAEKISYSMMSKKIYSQYFKWKGKYTYHYSLDDNICNFCEILNSDKAKVQEDLIKWWNADPNACNGSSFV